MSKIYILIGTRPNFIKVTRFKQLVKKYPNISIFLIHTGQHYDRNMTDIFFKEFNLEPDYFLKINPTSPSNQIAEILLKLDVLISRIGKPDLLIVPGDVNSTLAGALYANKNNIKLAHLEAGLRSFDKTMPEEFNRVLTDSISDLLFVTEESGQKNLQIENSFGEIFFVGNTMIDTLVYFEGEIEKSNIIDKLGIKRDFIVTTIHRPSNVDTKEGLVKLNSLFSDLSVDYDILFPVHPRTLNRIKEFDLEKYFRNHSGLKFLDPLGYFDFQKLVKECKFVLTDSGGIQEETTFRQVPCLTLRSNTERPITCSIGTNTLVPFQNDILLDFVTQIKTGQYKKGQIPPMWDGQATDRVLEILSRKIVK